MAFTTKAFLCASLVLSLPASTLAQSNGSAYCRALSDKYQRYVATNDGRHRAQTNAGPDNAMSHCQSDPASAIPVLERALQDAKVDLPPRA